MNDAKKYRSREFEVEAWQFTKENFAKWLPNTFRHQELTLFSQYGGDVIGGTLKTERGELEIKERDWIIKTNGRLLIMATFEFYNIFREVKHE